MNNQDPDKYIQRDISWLRFNERVLEEALDIKHNPLLERLRFIGIFVNNLDEFYMVRVAAIKNLIESGHNKRDRYGYSPLEVLQQIQSISSQLTKKMYDIYENVLLKELQKNEIHLKTYKQLNKDERKIVDKYFETTLYPIITPMAVDQGRPFPVIASKNIAFAVSLQSKKESLLAIMPVPKNVPRLLRLPSERNEFNFILIEDILREKISVFFRGNKIKDLSLFRILKDSEYDIDEEYAPDLLKAIEGVVRERIWAKVVSLEVESTCSEEFLEVLTSGLRFPLDEVTRISSRMDLTFLFEVAAAVDKTNLNFRSYIPRKLVYENIFEKIKQEDFITHVPFESFDPTLDLIQMAASDPNVLAIKMTLYRTDYYSAIIRSLKEAAKNQKQVTVLIEIKARFDEEQNIRWARELEEAGCHVIYGLAGLKIHSKMTLIVRKEEGHIRRYVHLSTGNYNEKTAKVYTDMGYFTANDDFAKDISDVFNVITGYSVPIPWKRVVSSPNDLRKYFFNLIDQEIKNQQKFKNGHITAKMNSLEDLKMIDKLYEASQAGVKIRLIIRGICCLIPGVPGLSENIHVKSIVGRLLEHSRIYIFNNNANPRVFLSSADWMIRNFDRRIELLFEIYKESIKEELQFIIRTYWRDDVKARLLQSDKTYRKATDAAEKMNAQEFLIDYYMNKK